MKTKLPLFLFILITLSSCSNYYMRKGNNFYQSMQYDKAIDNYNKCISKKSSNDVLIKLADCYRLNNDYKNAEQLYAQVVNLPGIASENFLYYGKALMNNGKYTEAKKWLLAYTKIKTNDQIAETLIVSCDSCNNFFIDSSKYALKAVEIPEVTTAFSQVKYNDGIVFAADRETFSSAKEVTGWTGRSYLDLYFSKKDNNGKWSAPVPLKGEINGPFHEGPAVFNETGKVVFFTRSNYKTAKKLRKNGKDESNLKLYRAILLDSMWTDLKELPFNSDEYSCGHPALFPNGNTLYFISDMPGGCGGTDIYKSTFSYQKDGSLVWSAPENLGADINTSGNEMFPYIHNDRTLYFSSDAHNTLGGLDIFSSSFNGEKWSVPANLNYPVNSSKDDFAFVLNDDNKTGYISSNRNDLDKIYEIELADPVLVLVGKVFDKESGMPVSGALVEIMNEKDNSKESFITNEKGEYTTKLKAEMNYKVKASKAGFLKTGDVVVSTIGKTRSETIRVDFQLEKLMIEKPIVLDNIYYDLDKWNIRKDAAAELDKFVSLLNNNPQITVELSSHTDSRADDSYNQILSEKRAKAAVKYLIKKGIAPNRLKWKGYGETTLVNKCVNGTSCNEEEHQQNRRTEFKVIKVNEMASGN